MGQAGIEQCGKNGFGPPNALTDGVIPVVSQGMRDAEEKMAGRYVEIRDLLVQVSLQRT